jgi:hypothetical protein
MSLANTWASAETAVSPWSLLLANSGFSFFVSLTRLIFVLQSLSLALSSSSFVRRADLRELGDKIAVGSYFILRNLSICDDGQEGAEDILGECPAINGKDALPDGS